MKVSGSKAKPVFTEINITPLTDIFLVLLIIVMIVAPFMQRTRRDIVPPEIMAGNALDKEWLTLEIAGDGSFHMEGTQIPEEQLAQSLQTRLMSLTTKWLVIRGDRQSKGHAVLKALEDARSAGFERVFIEGRELSGGGSMPAEAAPTDAAPGAPVEAPREEGAAP